MDRRSVDLDPAVGEEEGGGAEGREEGEQERREHAEAAASGSDRGRPHGGLLSEGASADVERAVEFVQSHVEQGHTVYIHCKAGRARSATVALCWLVRHRGLSPEEAQEKLLQERPHVKRTVWQRPVVTAFADQCRQETSAVTD